LINPLFLPGDNQIPETLGGLTLKEVPVAIDGIAIVVHPDLPISSLTVSQFSKVIVDLVSCYKSQSRSQTEIEV
jgi:ABC-type phosphate transport system substrate-binding protein